MIRIIILFLFFAQPPMALAHHSFDAEFDRKAPVTVRGKVTKVEWINPHAWIHVQEIKNGKPGQAWEFEAGTPNTLFRNGVTRDSLKVGMEIVVNGYQSRDMACAPACKANGRLMTSPDGKKLFIGSPRTDAPKDGADPNQK